MDFTAAEDEIDERGATFVIDYSRYLSEQARNIKPSGIRRFFDIENEMD